MEFKFIILFSAIWVLAYTMAASVPSESKDNYIEEEEDDNSHAESFNLLKSIVPPPASSNHGTYLSNVNHPYQAPHEVHYGTFAAPQPSFGVSVNTQTLLSPQVDILRLVESFLTVKNEFVARVHGLINDNYDLFRGVLNLVLSKLANLHIFVLNAVSVIRSIMEFVLTVFGDWRFTLPSLNLGASYINNVHPHEVYGLPQIAAGVGK